MTAPTTPPRRLQRSARPGGITPPDLPVQKLQWGVHHYDFPPGMAATAEQMYRGVVPAEPNYRLAPHEPMVTFLGNDFPVSFWKSAKDDHGKVFPWSGYLPVPEWSKYFAAHDASDAVSEHDISEAGTWIAESYGRFVCVSRYPFEVWGWANDIPVVVVVTFVASFKDGGREVAVLVRDRTVTDEVWAARCALMESAAADLGLDFRSIDFNHPWGGELP